MTVMRRSNVMVVLFLAGAMVYTHARTLRASEVIYDVTVRAHGQNFGTTFDRRPIWAVNDIGLFGNAHTNVANLHMWQAGSKPGWFRINLDRECYVEKIRVWNYNESGQWSKRGVSTADVYTAVAPTANTGVPGTGWDLLVADQVLTRAPGLNTYSTPNEITVNRTALYIGLYVKNNFENSDNNIGLSLVQVIGTPVQTVLISNVTATASSENTTHTPRLAINAVNGSGLVGKRHDTGTTNMWQSSSAAPQWFKVDLGHVYTLRRLDVWNYNEMIARGAATANIYTAITNPGTDPGGAGWTLVKEEQYFIIATGAAGYDTPTRILLNNRARYVGFEILTSHGGNLVGFSELQFHADPPMGSVFMVK